MVISQAPSQRSISKDLTIGLILVVLVVSSFAMLVAYYASKQKAEAEEKPGETAKAEPQEKPKSPKTSSARRKAPKKQTAAKVDKETPPDVQPLLATLKNVRDEIDKIVTELKSE